MKSLRILLLAVFALSLLFEGCASFAEMQKDGDTLPKSIEQGKALVYVVRPNPHPLLLVIMPFLLIATPTMVFVDDHNPSSLMGITNGSDYIYFGLEPGKHLIFSSSDRWLVELEVNAVAGEIIYIKQDQFMLIWSQRNYLSVINKYEGKYHVKRLAPGVIMQSDKPKKE
ncbi:hypothetical protein EPN96_00985 [bacterium]|nr:MAG: hypothetical protein EPN96_00985 [bacterium]